MENRKTLWIIFGIGLCVLVVVGAGFFWFLPEDEAPYTASRQDMSETAGRAGFDPVEWVRSEEKAPGFEKRTEDAGGDFVIISEELTYGLPEKTEVLKTDSDETAEPAAGDTKVIKLSVPAEKAVPAAAAAVPAAVPARPVQRAEPPRPEVKAEPAPPRRTTEYWIQAGSFSSLSKASTVKDDLSSKGVSSTISTVKVNTEDYYRVRIGPYATKPEAAKFLDWIKAVEGFAGSYISEVYVTR